MLGLGISLARGAFASIVTYVKDGLKLFYNFTEHQDNPISHASAGSTSFDGTNDYVSVAGDGSTTIKTFSAWVDLSSITSVSTGEVLIDYDNTSLEKLLALGSFTGNLTNELITIGGQSPSAWRASYIDASTTLDGWNHITWTWD